MEIYKKKGYNEETLVRSVEVITSRKTLHLCFCISMNSKLLLQRE